MHARILSQIVLFGCVQRYGDGAIVQAFVSIPTFLPLEKAGWYADFRKHQPEQWRIQIPIEHTTIEFSTDIPRRRIAFEPISIASNLLRNYSTINAIYMYDIHQPQRRLAPLGDIIDAVEQQGEVTVVQSQGRIGIVRLPELERQHSEIVDFVGGLIRVFRSDWNGARKLFDRVIHNPHAPTDILIDAHLYRALSNAKLGLPALDDTRAALALNPYAVRAVRYSIMANLAALQKAMSSKSASGEPQPIIEHIQNMITEHSALFIADDPWLKSVQHGLNQISAAIDPAHRFTSKRKAP